jgi:hypothetical protein
MCSQGRGQNKKRQKQAGQGWGSHGLLKMGHHKKARLQNADELINPKLKQVTSIAIGIGIAIGSRTL